MNQRGFSLPELLIAIALVAIAAGVGAALFGSAISTARANSQASRVSGLVQLARENAIRTQRDLELTFDTDRQIVRLLRNDDDQPVLIAEVALEYGVQLMLPDGPGDTPDAFGDNSATDFGDAERLFFISDGSLVDEDSVPVNGTIFLGVNNQSTSARAVTITGATARPRRYRWMGAEWAAQ